MNPISGNRALKGRKRKSSGFPVELAHSEYAATNERSTVTNDFSIETCNDSTSHTCHDAFVAAANAVGQLYQAAQNSKDQGARAALLKLYQSLPSRDDEIVSVGELKRYLVRELNSLDARQGGDSMKIETS